VNESGADQKTASQIHLSTTLVTMIAASAIVWVNVRFRESVFGIDVGWPYPIKTTLVVEQEGVKSFWYWTGLLIDLAAALTILFAM